MVLIEGSFAYMCRICKDSGTITAVKRGTHASFTFRCGMCEMAEKKGISKFLPVWSSQYKTAYENYSEYSAREGWKEK